ncbi:MAG: hypothetical protein LBU11_13070 [Zoogloeaceae bacterium]|jgi:hypothetical protein|nr:hypothetical protein [Zoogloeaceae bacterium]
MSKAIKVLLGIVVILVLFIAVGGWVTYKLVRSNVEETVTERTRALRAEVEEFVAALPGDARARFQECWQQAQSPEYLERVKAIVEKRLEKACNANDVKSMEGAQKYMRCATDLGIEVGREFAEEHFKTCKQKIGR